MKKFIFSLLLITAQYFSLAQHISNETDTIIMGPEKYQADVIRIYEKYNPIIDSLTKIRTSKNYNSNLDKKNNGNKEGYYINLQLNELEILVRQFLNINKVTGMFKMIDGIKKETYYEVSFQGNNKDLNDGKVRWYARDNNF